MEKIEREQNLDLFRQWVWKQESEDYQMHPSGLEKQKIALEAEYCRGEVAFYPEEIVELCVVSKLNEQNIFYLHFQMGSLEYAKERFQEMREAIESLRVKPPTKILLSCSCGITTYYFVDKLNQTSDLLNLDYEFSAASYTNLYSEGSQYDAIFLAPQIAYMCDSVKKTLPNVCVETIPPKLFAAYDVRQFYELVENTLNKEKITRTFPKPAAEHQEPVCHNCRLACQVLAIALLRRDYAKYHALVRIYGKNGEVVYNKDIIKDKFSINDIYDICDTVFARHPKIKKVCMAMPGIINEQGVTLKPLELDHLDMVGILSRKYKAEVTIENDVNCVALGYYACHKEYSSISVLFQPIIGRVGGMGSLHEGKLIKGLRNVAGEIQYMPIVHDSLTNPLWKTPEGARKLASQYLSSVISILGPEMILLYGRLFWDVEELRMELAKIIPESYIPEFRHLDHVKEYMLLGAMVACGSIEEVWESMRKGSFWWR